MNLGKLMFENPWIKHAYHAIFIGEKDRTIGVCNVG